MGPPQHGFLISVLSAPPKISYLSKTRSTPDSGQRLRHDGWTCHLAKCFDGIEAWLGSKRGTAFHPRMKCWTSSPQEVMPRCVICVPVILGNCPSKGCMAWPYNVYADQHMRMQHVQKYVLKTSVDMAAGQNYWSQNRGQL